MFRGMILSIFMYFVCFCSFTPTSQAGKPDLHGYLGPDFIFSPIASDSADLQVGSTPIQPIPNLSNKPFDECQGDVFPFTAGRTFKCLCGKDILGISSYKYLIDIDPTYKIGCQEHRSVVFGVWRKLSEGEAERLNSRDIKRLPFSVSIDDHNHKNFVIMACSHHCEAVKTGIEELKKKYERLTEEKRIKDREIENILYYGKPMNYRYISTGDYRVTTKEEFCSCCNTFLVEYRECTGKRENGKSYRLSQSDDWKRIHTQLLNYGVVWNDGPKFHEKKGYKICRQCYIKYG